MLIDPSAVIHPTAIVDDGASIGPETSIWHHVHVRSGAVIGARCSIGKGCYIGNVTIGDGVKVQNNVSVYDGVTLEDDVFCGPSCVFTNVINPRSAISRMSEVRETRVKRGGTIGANATIICGCTLGEYSFVGAGAVVTRDVEPNSLVLGVPARHVGWICSCGERLAEAGEVVMTCAACGETTRPGTSAWR